MKFLKDTKAQGALEYLLIIGGAILIAAIVIGVLVQTAGTAKDTTGNAISDFNGKIDDALKDINFEITE